MKDEEMPGAEGDDLVDAKAYDQREGEPNKWYERFLRFCELGPARNLRQCYRMVMEEQDAAASNKGGKAVRRGSGQAAPKREHTPATWRRYARAYEWEDRAATWDAEQRRLAVKHVEETLIQVSHDAQEVYQFYKGLMRGRIKNFEGEMVPVTDIYQRRMAAKALQHWAATARAALQEYQEEGDEVPIKEIRAHEPVEDDEKER